MDSLLERSYYRLTKLMDSHLMSFLMGAVSSVAINVATSSNLDQEQKIGVTILAFAVLCLLKIGGITKSIENMKTILDASGGDDEVNYRIAADFKNKNRVRTFFIALILSFGATGVGIWYIHQSNIKKIDEQAVEKKMIEERINQYEAKLDRSASRFTDSLRAVLKEQSHHCNPCCKK